MVKGGEQETEKGTERKNREEKRVRRVLSISFFVCLNSMYLVDLVV